MVDGMFLGDSFKQDRSDMLGWSAGDLAGCSWSQACYSNYPPVARSRLVVVPSLVALAAATVVVESRVWFGTASYITAAEFAICPILAIAIKMPPAWIAGSRLRHLG